jgi:hypothetical protein
MDNTAGPQVRGLGRVAVLHQLSGASFRRLGAGGVSQRQRTQADSRCLQVTESGLLWAALANGSLQLPPIERHALEAAARAHERLESRATRGALVLIA